MNDDQPQAAPEPRHVHIDLSKTGDRTGVYLVNTWRCKCTPCGVLVERGKPCGNCGRGLLLG